MRLFDESGNEVFLYQIVGNAGADQKFYATTDGEEIEIPEIEV